LTASALGLGEISLRSALNQPFVAEIPVTSASAEDLGQLSVQLAPAATFERYGLDRPRFLDDLKFQIQTDGSQTVVRITSTQPVSEPFVSILLDVGWPQGRLLREYTVLLDPPTFAAPGSAGQESSRPAAAPPASAGPAAAPPPAIRRTPPPENVTAATPGSTAGPATGSVTSGPDGDSYGPVRANETLWRISERLSADTDASLNQMMVALYRANPEAFAGNINRLRRGAILRVPRGSDLTAITSGEATAEVQRQDQEWRGAVSPTPAPAPARLQLVPPAEKAVGAGSGPAAADSGEAARRAALEQELAEKQRLISLKDSQLKALQERVSQLEGRAPQAPAELPAGPPGEETVEPVADGGPATAPIAADSPAAEPERKPAKRPVRERPAAGGGIIDTLSGLVFNVWFLISAAAVLLASLLVFGRRRLVAAGEASSPFDRNVNLGAGADARSTQPVIRRDGYSVEEIAVERAPASVARQPVERATDAETPLERTISTEGAVELDQADVVAEANFHLAYGLYDQAAELLLRALRETPERRDLRLKLIEVYFVWENKAAFLKEAQIFHQQLRGAADPDWNKVVILGKQMCPGESLFAGAVVSTGDAGLDLDLVDDDKGGVDFSFDDDSGDGLDLDLPVAREDQTGNLLDLDLGDAYPSTPDTPTTAVTPTVKAPKAGDDVPTMETPTIESRTPGESTMETPTVEFRTPGESTMETPTIEFRTPGESTMETPTLESAVPGMSGGSADSPHAAGAEQTEEINLEDLGLDLAGLDEAADDLGTGVHGTLAGEDDASGDEEAYDLGSEEDESDLLLGLEGDATSEMRGITQDDGTLDQPAAGGAMGRSAGRKRGESDPTAETAAHRTIEDTAEQPRVTGGRLGEISGELSQVDVDIGENLSDELEPTTAMAPGRTRGPEGPTMTEVGTKLDLARAYIDMGDPDGARSILNEVLDEGDPGQRQEARRLLDDLAD